MSGGVNAVHLHDIIDSEVSRTITTQARKMHATEVPNGPRLTAEDWSLMPPCAWLLALLRWQYGSNKHQTVSWAAAISNISIGAAPGGAATA